MSSPAPGPAGFRGPLTLIFVLAVTLRIGHLVESEPWPWHTWNQTDMDTYLRVAGQILEGDLLVREPYHPYHQWQRAIAPPEWWSGLFEPHVFLHVPGYAYVLAVLLKFSGGSLGAVQAVQCVLGALHSCIVGALAYRLFGRLEGLLAGLMAATYGPFIAAEPMILREGLGLLLAAAALYPLIVALTATAPGESGARRWLWAGVALGAGTLVREAMLLVFGPAWLFAGARGLRSRQGARPFLALSAGFLLGVSPLLARNLAVGARPLASSPLATMSLVIANAADAPAKGVLFDLPPSFKSVMDVSRGRMFPALEAVRQGYAGRPGLFARNLWARFAAIWSNVELPDNYSYAYVALHSHLLPGLPRFVCVWLPAVLGLGLLLWEWGAGRVGAAAPAWGSPAPAALGLLGLVLAAEVLAQSLEPVMGRYRLSLVPLLMLLAAFSLGRILARAAQGRWRGASACGAGLLLAVLAWLAWPEDPVLRGAAIRPADFSLGASLMAGRGDLLGSYREVDRGIRHFRERLEPPGALQAEVLLRKTRLVLFVEHGRADAVRSDWEALRHLAPGDPWVARLGGTLGAPPAEPTSPGSPRP